MTETSIRIFCCLLLGTLCASAATDREVAEWAIRLGGRVTLSGARTPINDLLLLPEGDFQIKSLDLVGTLAAPKELEKIAGLTALRDLYLPGPMWTPVSDSQLDANDALKALAGLKNLERLYFSLHFLPTYNVTDKGVALMAGLTQLRELRIAQSRVVKPDLAPFAHLESLDLYDSAFTDDGMKALAGLKELKRLYLRNTAVSDDGLRYLSGLTRIEELDLYGVKVTDRGLDSLQNLKAMRKLNLLGAEITDAGLDPLAGMTHLRELNLYRSHITNAGVSKLTTFKELAALDVRYSRVTETGVEGFHAANPHCNVEFAGGSATADDRIATAKPAGSSEQEIGAWVRTVGGKADFGDGELRAVSLSA